MPPKKKVAEKEPTTSKKLKTSVSPIDSFSLKVGSQEFRLPIECVKKFPNTTLGSLLLSFDDTDKSCDDLEFPERNSAIFEKIVVPFYTNNGSLGTSHQISLFTNPTDALKNAKLIESVQTELDYWGIPTNSIGLSLSIKDLQSRTNAVPKSEETKKSKKKSKSSKKKSDLQINTTH
jgi:hypothetical protein